VRSLALAVPMAIVLACAACTASAPAPPLPQYHTRLIRVHLRGKGTNQPLGLCLHKTLAAPGEQGHERRWVRPDGIDQGQASIAISADVDKIALDVHGRICSDWISISPTRSDYLVEPYGSEVVGELVGQVIDAASGAPIANAKVEEVPSTSPGCTGTASDGRFILRPQGPPCCKWDASSRRELFTLALSSRPANHAPYHISVSAPGYQPAAISPTAFPLRVELVR
jgi:hypothetical protein